MKKRPGWHVHSPPGQATKPVMPIASWESISSKPFHHAYSSEVALKSVSLPDGVAWNDVVIQCDCYDGDYTVTFCKCVETTVQNPNFKQQMKRYKDQLARYEAGEEGRKQELADWKVWKAEEEQKELAQQLKHAEDLLRKHGKLA